MRKNTLKIDRAEGMRLKSGSRIKCNRGIVWLTADNQDIILKPGDEHIFQKRVQMAVVAAFDDKSVIEITDKGLFLKQFSLFNYKLRFTGALSG